MSIEQPVILTTEPVFIAPSPSKRLRRYLPVLTLGLVLVNLVLGFAIVLQLMRAGQEAIGLLITIVGGLTALLSVRFEQVSVALRELLTDRFGWVLPPLAQLLLLLVLVAGRAPLLAILGQERMSEGLSTANFSEAWMALEQARTLDWDVAGTLAQELQITLSSPVQLESGERSIHLANLLLIFSDDTMPTRLGLRNWLIEESCTAATKPTSSLLATVLALLDPNKAVLLANDLNNAALLLATGADAGAQTPQLCQQVYAVSDQSLAVHFLETVRAVDLNLATSRPFPQQSISRSNLATYLQVFGTQMDTIERSQTLYLEALELDPTNYAARYGLTSMWLTNSDRLADTALVLDRSVQIAHQGWAQLENTGYCDGVQDMANADTAEKAWYCFLLMTTEAASRLERIQSDLIAPDDSLAYTLTLLDRVIQFAEQNNHFGGRFTAEAYFYTAQALGLQGEVDTAVLCAIIQHSDINSPRHFAWRIYANEHLGDQRCR
jgi:hypothetical protein